MRNKVKIKSKKEGIYKGYISKGCPLPRAPDRKKVVIGIDPGLDGAIVIFDGKDFGSYAMPLKIEGKNRMVDFDGVHELLFHITDVYTDAHIYLERAVSFGMGVKGAYNYGRGFAAIEIAIELLKMRVTYVEPAKWTKEIHEGISSDLKPKAKSLIAVKRLFPNLVGKLPKNRNGKILDGPIDALLIAAYGHRRSEYIPPKEQDFF